MNRTSALSIVCVFCASPVLADPTWWTPSPEDVQKADDEIGQTVDFSGFTCPPRPKAAFYRHYWGWADKAGHRSLGAQLVLASAETNQVAGVHIEKRWYPIADGGCSIANVWFDADTLEVFQASWGGR